MDYLATALFVCTEFYGILGANILMLQDARFEVHLFVPSSHLGRWPIRGLRWHDGGAEPETMLPKLREHLKENHHGLVILNDDGANKMVAPHRDEREFARCFPIQEPEVSASLAFSKIEFAKYCLANDLPIPEQQTVPSKEEFQAAVARLGFPIILKPDAECAGKGISIVREPSELESAWRKSYAGKPLLVQRFVIGRVGVIEALYDQGRLVGWLESSKLHVFPEPLGPSVTRRVEAHPETQDILTRFGIGSRCHGMMGFDCMYENSSNRLYLLELNARPTSGFRLGPLAGEDFGRALREMAEGKSPDPMRPTWRRGAIIPLFPQALQRTLSKRLLIGTLSILLNPNFWRTVPWDHRKLAWKQLSDALRQVFKLWRQSAARGLERVSRCATR